MKPSTIFSYALWFGVGIVALIPGVVWMLAGGAALTGTVKGFREDAP